MRQFCSSLLLFSLMAVSAWAQDVGSREFRATLGKSSATLTGKWAFHTGDDVGWASASLDDSRWEAISAGKPWGAQGHPGYTGYAWYRKRVEVDGVTTPVSILLPQVDTAYELYWNGQLIGGFGRLPPHARWDEASISNVFTLPAADASGRLKGVVAIRVWKAMLGSLDPIDGGGLSGPPQIGEGKLLANALALREGTSERTRLVPIIECAIFFLVGALAVALWAFDRSRRLYLWLGVYLLAQAGMGLFLFPDYRRFEVFQWDQLYQAVITSARDLGIWMLVLVLFGLDAERGWRRATAVLAALYLGAWAADVGAAAFWGSGWQPLRRIDGVSTAVYSLLPTYLLVLLIAGLRRRRDLTLLPTVLACAVLEIYTLLLYGLGQGVQFTHLNFLDFVSKATIVIGRYGFPLTNQLGALVVVTLMATIYREQMRERSRQLFIESELKAAREIQSVLVPEETPPVPGFAISSLYWPAGEVGGDMFQVLPGIHSDVIVVLADVSGKGLKAAMTVSLMVGVVRTMADTMTSPMAILTGLNRRLLGRTNGGFATCLVLHLSAGGEVTMANAGHLSPFLNGEALPLEGSLPLGIAADAIFSESRFCLREGDEVSLYTDGVLEAQREDGELFGFERAAEMMRSMPSVQTIAETARNFGQRDDITVLKLARVAEEDTRERISMDLRTMLEVRHRTYRVESPVS